MLGDLMERCPTCDGPVASTNGKKRAVCGAKTKGNGKPCRKRPMANGRCRNHGGKTPKGIASPHHIHGRYSKYGPKVLRDRSAEFLSDPDILSLHANLALTDARLADTLQKLETGGGLDALTRLRALVDKVRVATTEQEKATALGEMFTTIEAAGGTAELLHALDRLTEQRRKLVETEVRRQTSDQTSITLDRAFGFIDLLLDIVARHVKERQVLAAIVEEVAGLRAPASHQLTSGQ